MLQQIDKVSEHLFSHIVHLWKWKKKICNLISLPFYSLEEGWSENRVFHPCDTFKCILSSHKVVIHVDAMSFYASKRLQTQGDWICLLTVINLTRVPDGKRSDHRILKMNNSPWWTYSWRLIRVYIYLYIYMCVCMYVMSWWMLLWINKQSIQLDYLILFFFLPENAPIYLL